MPCLLLFDIDGTILKFKKPLSRTIFSNVFLELFNIKPNDNSLPDFAGMTDLAILKEIAFNNGVNKDELYKNLTTIWKRLTENFINYCVPENLELMPGILELLSNLKKTDGITLGLLTGNFKGCGYMKLKVYGIDETFPIGAFGDEYDDRNLLPPLAINRANEYKKAQLFSIANTIIIGDTPRDILCGKANNIPVICVATGNFSISDLSPFEPDYLLKDLSDIENFFRIIEVFTL